MRSIKLFFKKDIPIFLEWYWNELKKDFTRIFLSATDKETYNSILDDAFKVLKKTKLYAYVSFVLFIISFSKKQFIWAGIWFSFFLIIYALKYWLSGEPLKFYKEKYFKTEKFK